MVGREDLVCPSSLEKGSMNNVSKCTGPTLVYSMEQDVLLTNAEISRCLFE
jgi:hypothetical protein